MKLKYAIVSIFNFLTFRSARISVHTSLIRYYEEYNKFVEDQNAMHDALNTLDSDAPVEMVIKAYGDAKTYQKKAIEHIKRCLKLAPTAEEKERLILELDSIRAHQAA